MEDDHGTHSVSSVVEHPVLGAHFFNVLRVRLLQLSMHRSHDLISRSINTERVDGVLHDRLKVSVVEHEEPRKVVHERVLGNASAKHNQNEESDGTTNTLRTKHWIGSERS